ncbi:MULTISPECIES: adenosine deaminase [unclassified Mesorhizobium]|uniref:adenosine deaminase n=1 Tax=unclassified Mesorhizobium TaxID=325217 RepID=UPI000F7621B7|nr:MULTISPECIES: adenosine deaminase [unclassified Mesorhizobium]AZO05728.1 adenosine deaminase [Mesorhizobium sp. M2A.F.Ca.ET.043.02.1.1]RUW43214.1 adenosine deaminase [Mesorhizobium sp. M2A.F.Ca.ET.015.02.1.1]RUW71779.1 adenosine deaminase [Mesorhizobium sp. M2A.F.Ca.ET.067.02.1.1]RVC96229.1 adenosine deaminase [Mesorhizobium sp. M2A.F.Ca.ET.017.03.2.1]RVD10193.1 adenosine deaminase [Mesorhizobium sp. M2A.F.Ca.ET.029.05.1.1]
MSLASFVQQLPKVELHLHLEGAVSASTFADLAALNSVALPKPTAELYSYDNLPDFLKIYDLVCASIKSAADFSRVTFEALERCAIAGARYVELFFSPHAHLAHGVSYSNMLAGVLDGMRRAKEKYGVVCKLIPAHSRELGPERGEQFLDMVLAERVPDVIGIGLDYNEAPFPPAPYATMYERARSEGLNVTAHAGESGPAENVADSIDLLGVRRIDHGYHVVDDPALVERCKEAGIVFTCCPSTTLATTVWRDLAAPGHAIRRMIEAGLNVTIHSDDPPMFATTLDREYALVMDNFALSPEALKKIALAGLEAAWLDNETKQAWMSEWSAEIDGLLKTELLPN